MWKKLAKQLSRKGIKMSKENIINKLKKLSNSWADIGTILGQQVLMTTCFI